jgi:hypothetical protein
LLSHAQANKGCTALVTYCFGVNFWVQCKGECKRCAPRAGA